MNKKRKIIATAALFTFVFTTVPVVSMAKDSVRKWGYWEDMVTPAAGPELAALITPSLQDSSPDFDPDPIIDPIDPVDPEVPGLFGYTTVFAGEDYYYPEMIDADQIVASSLSSEIYRNGVATIIPYFDPDGDPDGTVYDSQYFIDNYEFNPTGTGGFSYSPFGPTATDNGLLGNASGEMPTDFSFILGSSIDPAILALGLENINPDGIPQTATALLQFRELTDKDGGTTGIYEAFWGHIEAIEQEQRVFYVYGQAYYATLAPLSYIDGPAQNLPTVSDIGALENTGNIDYRGNIQGIYTGYTQSGMDVTVGIDFNQSTFAGTFGANDSAGFAATGILNGQHMQSTALSGINDTVIISGEVRASLHGANANAMTGGIDINKTVVNDRIGVQEIHQVEAFAASTNGIDK